LGKAKTVQAALAAQAGEARGAKGEAEQRDEAAGSRRQRRHGEWQGGARAAFVAHAFEAAEPERGSSQAVQQQAVRALGKARAVQAALAAQAAEAAEARGQS
jgi:hypothetical protein